MPDEKNLKRFGWKGLQVTEKNAKPASQLMTIFTPTLFIKVTPNRYRTDFQKHKEYWYSYMSDDAMVTSHSKIN